MSKRLIKQSVILLTLSLITLSSISPIVPHGPKVPPVEQIQ